MPEIYIPTCAEIEAPKEGDLAPDCFGHWRRVTKVYANRSNTVIFTADGKGAWHQWGHLGGITLRIFMGHCRTVCNCDLCAINCRFIPGYLLPEDLDKIAMFLGYSKLFEFAEKNLLASPGALVIKNRRLCRIRTLVPARGHSGWCKFFDGSLCSIHRVGPFGCAFFDSHQEQSESNTISAKGLQIIAELWEDQPFSLYCQIWNDLHRRGMRAPAPEECRDRMSEQSGKS